MSSDNYYLVRPATRREKNGAGLSGPAWAVEMRFASLEYIPGERNRVHYLSRELDEATAWANNEYSEYGYEVEPALSLWVRLVAPIRVWFRDTKMRVWYWWRGGQGFPARWGRVKAQFDLNRARFKIEQGNRRLVRAFIKCGWALSDAGHVTAYATKSVVRLIATLATPSKDDENDA